MKISPSLPRPGFVLLHLATLCTLSVAQPLYDLFATADHAAFFVAHQAKAIDLWLMVALLSAGLPLVLFSMFGARKLKRGS